jgi:transposase-like protein
VNTVYTQQFKVDVVGEYLAGRHIDDICDDYLIDRRRLSAWRQALGAPKRPLLFRRGPPRRVDHADVRRLHARGLSDMAIARELRAGRTTVRDARVALGLQTHSPRAVAALALLLFASGAQAHDWYAELKRPDTGTSCCSGQDCRPVDPCNISDHETGMLLDGVCERIPHDKILPIPSPDGQIHACYLTRTPAVTGGKPEHTILCVIEGGGA